LRAALAAQPSENEAEVWLKPGERHELVLILIHPRSA
jgi:hypothetical protein